MSDLYAVVMAGGSGTRFWPASRRAKPKQFLAVAGESSMIAETWARLDGLVPVERRLVVATAAQAELVRQALPQLPLANLVLEPLGRNTGPCIALASAEIARRAPRSVQVILPADHVIRPAEAFRATLAAAAEEADASGALVTLGIRPTQPATGFGYIEAGDTVATRGGQAVRNVLRFVEKPKREKAVEFVASGRFFWNSGLFVWRTDVIEGAIAKHMPAVRAALERAARGEALEPLYRALQPIAIDVAVMERATDRRMLVIDYVWSDVGAWDALAGVNPADAQGNVATGGAQLVAEDASGCIVHGANGEIVALIGVKDLVVVHARGATLVVPKDRAQDVKAIVERLEREHGEFL
ncbi:MAG: NTP transferase domain-containing protein [Planctomycetes bacterium]|nr:NTP transferase domain-containing protein [Planctomycetota bacterium]